MKNLIKFFVVLILLVNSSALFSQEIPFERKSKAYYHTPKIENPSLNSLPSGVYSVGDGGDFVSLDSAFNKLSIDGIQGQVTLELIDNLYNAPTERLGYVLNGPILGANADSRVILKPAENKNVTIEGNGMGVLCFFNTSYFTIDGIDKNGSTSLTVHSLKNSQYDWNDGIAFINGSKHNEVKNIVLECEDYLGIGCGIVFVHESGPFTPDSNLIQNNFIKKAAMGISIISYSYRPQGNIISGNKIGSDIDFLISRGINLTLCKQTIIENNIIQNIRNNPSLVYSPGIVSLAGVGDIIRKNVVYNVKVDNGEYGGIGILLNGTTNYSGCSNLVYNNMVYDIQSTSTHFNSKVTGIELCNQMYSNIFYNSVYLKGNGNNSGGSASLFIGANCSNINVINNILVNTRDESPFCAKALYISSLVNLSSDYNDLYSYANEYNCLVQLDSSYYDNLYEWQLLGKDLHSLTEMPNFIEPYLHIQAFTATSISGAGTPIGWIEYDFDTDTRDTFSPDIGADEFLGIPSELEIESPFVQEYVLEQNFPNPFNPSTKISYSIFKATRVILTIFDISGNEIAVLVNEDQPTGSYELKWSDPGLPSGVYFYQLIAGSFVETKKMVLMK